MAARAKITMSPEEYLAGLKKLEAETNKSANKMENSFKAYGTSINKAGIAMRYVSAEMGAGAVAFGRAFQVLAGGKIAIAVAAVTGAITGLMKAWDHLTVSAKEYQAKLRDQVEMNQKNVESLRRTQDEEDSMMERLQELATRENKTNEETDEQIRLAEILTGRYGKLGISVGDLTGDYETLIKTIGKMNDAQKGQRETLLEGQHTDTGKLIESMFRENITPGFWGKIGNALSFGKSVDQQVADFRSMLPKQQKELVNQRYIAATTDEERTAWKNLLDILDQQVDTHERIVHLKKTGYETDQDEIKAKEAQAEASRKAADAEEAAHQKRVADIEAEMLLDAEKDKKASEAYQKRIQEEEKLSRSAQRRRMDDIAVLRFAALRKTGRGQQAAVEEALYNETKAQGRELDAATRKDVTARAKARYALENLRDAPTTNPQMYAPRVDSLIARGGSAAPVKMPKLESLQEKQLSTQESTNRIASRILNKVEEWTKI